MKIKLGAAALSAAISLTGCAPAINLSKYWPEKYEQYQKCPTEQCLFRIPQDLPHPALLVGTIYSIDGQFDKNPAPDSIVMTFDYPFYRHALGGQPFTEILVSISKNTKVPIPSKKIGLIKAEFGSFIWTYTKDVDKDGDIDGVIEFIRQNPDPTYYQSNINTYHAINDGEGNIKLRRKWQCSEPCEYSPILTEYHPFN